MLGRAPGRSSAVAGRHTAAAPTSRGSARPSARLGLAGAVRDRLHGGRRGDLLLARRGRRPRARADAVRLPRRRADVRAGGDDLRRGRVAAPGPRRLDGLRPLRLQRAVGFIAGWAILLDYTILIAVTAFSATNYLAAFCERVRRRRRRSSLLSLRDHRLRRGAQHPRLLDDARRTGSPRSSLADIALQVLLIVARARAASSTSHALARPDPPRHHAAVGRRDLRGSAWRPSCSPAWSRRRAWRARWRSGARGLQAADRERVGRRSWSSTSASRPSR